MTAATYPTFTIDLPRADWRPIPDRPGRPPLTWLALALALALVGLSLANLLLGMNLMTAAGAYLMAMLPTAAGLGIALAMLTVEITPCLES